MTANNSFLDHVIFRHHYQSLGDTLFRAVSPSPLANPALLLFNATVARDFFATDKLSEQEEQRLIAIASGNALADSMSPIAQKYCGHQFGVFNPALGDGRGLLLGEFETPEGELFDLHLKGAGPTPFSRGADGRAVVRSSIREYLISEYLYQIGLPATRSLAVIQSSTPVQRETEEQAASLLRIARTHIRFGHFEYLFHTGQHDKLQQLMDHVISLYYPELVESENRYASLFDAVMVRTAIMIAHWQAQGFCHGVMNTDNFSIVGETFDFGPFSMMDRYDPRFICNHTDWQGRYAYNQQPRIGLWNLNALAACFSALVEKDLLTESLQRYSDVFHDTLFQVYSDKLGIDRQHPDAETLIEKLLHILEQEALDFPLTFISLTDDTEARLNGHSNALNAALTEWSLEWQLIQQALGLENALERMQQNNPRYPLRNGIIQQAIADVSHQDHTLLQLLNRMVQNPFIQDTDLEFLREPPATTSCNLTLSCSS